MKSLRETGFTLIELMVVVTILSILMAIAYPIYKDYVTKSRRGDGKAKLLEIAQREERFFTDNNTYTTDLTKLGYATNPVNSDLAYYSIAAAAGPTGSITTSFTLTATRQNQQANDTKCGNYSLTSTNVKNATGTEAASCW
jgi:type IV pilus assembly protein PilE